jgi:hypothetical protein
MIFLAGFNKYKYSLCSARMVLTGNHMLWLAALRALADE